MWMFGNELMTVQFSRFFLANQLESQNTYVKNILYLLKVARLQLRLVYGVNQFIVKKHKKSQRSI